MRADSKPSSLAQRPTYQSSFQCQRGLYRGAIHRLSLGGIAIL